MRNLGRAVPAEQRRHDARQPERDPAAARPRQGPGRRRRRPRPRPKSPASATATTSTSTARRSATPASTPGTSPSWSHEGRAPAIDLRPHRPRSRPLRLRPAVLVLLVLQPVQRPPRGRLGGDADHLRSANPPPRRWPKNRAKSSSSSTPAASAPTGPTRKVQKEGTHPVVYPAAGSHATFYDSAVYVQNGQNGSGRRLRQHHRAAARTAAASRCCCPNRGADQRPLQWLSY